ncbi:hypothetical protein DL767_002991 [Monosporascus sp. MG133]|nr:hypothetical protein DL767_002991 [Monosporascus sp. MG133]
MSTAHHLSQYPEKFAVTLTDAVNYCGGQAFSISLDKERYGTSWANQGVHGGSFVHHLMARHQNEVKRLVVQLKSRTPVPGAHNPVGGDSNAPVSEEVYDEIVLRCLADTAKNVLGRTAKEKKGLGSAKFSDDITITHNDSDYMKKHYKNFYKENLAVEKLGGVG